MTTDATILAMLRAVVDLRVCKPACWAVNFGREAHEIEALILEIRKERADIELLRKREPEDVE